MAAEALRQLRAHPPLVARRRLVAVAATAALAASPLAARAAEQRDGVGLAAGQARGYGFTYIHHTAEGWATTATGVLLKSGGDLRWDAAAGLQRTLAGESRHRLYGAGEVAYLDLTDDHDHDFNLGVALGVEFLFSSRIGVSGEAAEVWKTRTGDIVITPAIAAHYYF